MPNKVLSGIILERAGKDTSGNKVPISEADHQKLQTSSLFSVDKLYLTPVKRNFYNITLLKIKCYFISLI